MILFNLGLDTYDMLRGRSNMRVLNLRHCCDGGTQDESCCQMQLPGTRSNIKHRWKNIPSSSRGASVPGWGPQYPGNAVVWRRCARAMFWKQVSEQTGRGDAWSVA